MTALSAIDTSFRVAMPDDALCIGALAAQTFLDTYAIDGIRPSLAREVQKHFSTDTIAELLSAPSRVFILAERSGHLIGFAQLAFDASQESVPVAPAAELERLYVQPRFASTGIGKALLAQGETLAAARGMKAVWLTAWVGNARALSFYGRQGYRDVGTTEYVFENEAYENRVFLKELTRQAAA
jgi:diamine N-acetyltransferase